MNNLVRPVAQQTSNEQSRSCLPVAQQTSNEQSHSSRAPYRSPDTQEAIISNSDSPFRSIQPPKYDHVNPAQQTSNGTILPVTLVFHHRHGTAPGPRV